MKTHITLLTLAVASLSTLAADVTGTWKAEFDTQRGLQKYTFTLKQDGSSVTGKANVEGDTVTFVEPLKIQDNDVRIIFTGRISGNEIKFTRKVGDFGSSEATAKREASTAPSAGQRPGGGRGGFGGPIELKPDDKPAFPNPAEGFDKERDSIAHGK